MKHQRKETAVRMTCTTANNILSEDLKILVFRSNIDTAQNVALVRNELLRLHRIYRVDIDLEDPENVLRVECHPDSSSELIRESLAELGFNGNELSYEIFDGNSTATNLNPK